MAVTVGPESQPEQPDGDFEAAREKSEAASNEAGGGQIQFEDGFTWKVVIGALFVGLIMLPGSIYMGLVVGQSLGPAAQWVTIVLFSEVCRRSFLPLKRQEIYCIYYMAGALVGTGFSALPGMSGGPFSGLIGYAYLLNSPQMANVAPHLPGWIAPHIGSPAYSQRTFLDSAWIVPIGILVFNQIFDRMKWMGLGFMLFKLTSDVERLPFPLAPVAASGATALAEANTKEESWRWSVFSTGSVLGLVFGLVYMAVPIISGVMLGKPITLLQIPFFDMTPNTEASLPTSLIGYNPDLSAMLTGFVLPYQIVLGSFISSVLFQIGVNPILYHMHMFPDFVSGSGAIQAQIALNFDFWMSFGIGLQLAIAIIGIVSLVHTLRKNRTADNAQRGSLTSINKARGDFPWYYALGAWAVASLGYILLCHTLVPKFPVLIIMFYALIWTPLNSYVSARMIALTGAGVTFPFLNQAVVLKSGYHDPDIWFAPLPLNDYGPNAQRFREIELTGTKFTSILKVELLMLPLILVASFMYWGFLWHTSDIPSAQFPFAQKMWPISATSQAIWTQINAIGGNNWVIRAIKPNVIAMGAGAGLGLYAISIIFKLPLLFFYGFVGGAGAFPHNTIPTFLGSMLGRFYFARRFGTERWSLYAPVLLAGYFCGMGLVGMAAIAIALIGKTVNYLPF